MRFNIIANFGPNMKQQIKGKARVKTGPTNLSMMMAGLLASLEREEPDRWANATAMQIRCSLEKGE